MYICIYIYIYKTILKGGEKYRRKKKYKIDIEGEEMKEPKNGTR